jgi:hypothetical protein
MKKSIIILASLVLVLSAFAPPQNLPLTFHIYMPIIVFNPPGSVRGTFLSQVGDPITIQDFANLYTPITNANLYLAEVRWCPDHQCGVAILDLVNNPRTITDSGGSFEFFYVDPGDYALIYYDVTSLPPTYHLISQPTSTEALWFSVESNRLTDLGTMKYSCFPTYCLPMSPDGEAINLSIEIKK